MKAVIYARVSTSKQENENQLLILREFCEKNKYEISKEYIDVITGTTKERPAFDQLFKDAAQRKFDVVVFWALDRFTREGAQPALQYLNMLNSYNVQFQSYSEQYLDSTGIFRDPIISILATLAKQEALRISERTKLGLQRVRSKGQKLGRPSVDFDKFQAQKMRDNGDSYSVIAKKLKVGKTTIAKFFTSNK